MHIFEIKYSRGRTVQPRAYESDRIDVELTAQLVEGENVEKSLELLRSLTLKEVGRNKPGKVTETATVTEKVAPVIAGVEEDIAAQSASEAAGTEPASTSASDAATTDVEEANLVKAKKAAAAKAKRAEAKAAKEAAAPADTAREATGDIQDEELVAEAAKAAATITPQGVKDIMADFGVPRLSVIAQEKRPEFIQKLKDAIKARKDADSKATPENEIPL